MISEHLVSNSGMRLLILGLWVAETRHLLSHLDRRVSWKALAKAPPKQVLVTFSHRTMPFPLRVRVHSEIESPLTA